MSMKLLSVIEEASGTVEEAAKSGIASIDISTTEGKLNMGLQVVVVGMLVVFAVLAILWFALVLFKFFCYDLPQKRKKEPELSVKQEVTEVPVPIVQNNDEEIIVAIAAAIAAAEAEEPWTRFRVVAFRRVS